MTTVLARRLDPPARRERRRHRRLAAAAVPPDRRPAPRPTSASPPARTSPPGPAVDGLVDRLARRRRHPPPPDGVAVHGRPTSPSSCRRSCSASRRWPRSSRCCPGVAAVIAVDDASEPPVRAVDGARVLRLRTNAGPAVARNAGLGAVDDAARRLRRHRRPPRAGLARPPARPLRRPPGRPRRAARRQRAGRRTGRRLRAGPLAARPRPGAGPDRAGHAAQLRAGGGDRRAHRRAAGDRRLRPHAALRRGRRRRLAPRRGRLALPLRAGRRWSTTGRAARGAASSPSASATARRPRRWPSATAARSAPVRMSGWSAGGVGARSSPVTRVAGLGRRRRHRRRPRAQAARACPAAESLRLAGLGHLHAGRLLADAGRRAWWPLLVAGARGLAAGAPGRRCSTAVPALLGGGIPRLVDDLAYGVGRVEGRARRAGAGPSRPGFTSWPGRTRPTSARRSARSGRSRRTAGAAPAQPRYRRRRDAAPHRRHRRVAGPRRPRRPALPGPGPRRQGQRLRVRARRAGRASPPRLADTIAVGTVHELDHVPAGVTPVVLTPTWQPPADTVPILTVGSVAHVRALDGWRGRVLVKLASSVRRFGTTIDELGALTGDGPGGGARRRRLQHPPARRRHRRRAPRRHRGVARRARRDDEVWVSHLSPDAYDDLVDGWPERRFRIRVGTALWHGDKRALHLDADVLDVRPGAGRRARRLPPAARARRRPPRDGRRRHRPRRATARRRPQPVPLRPPAAGAARAAAHAHVDGRSCRPARSGPGRPSASTCSAR